MPTSGEWPIFLGMVFVYAAMPGPALVYVMVRSLHGGRRAGVLSAVGNSLGTVTHVAATAVGLSAVVAGSPTTLTVIKLAGAGYLVLLGVQIWRREPTGTSTSTRPEPGRSGSRSPLVQGLIVEALNPSTALFFVALLPQFVHPARAEPRVTVTVLGLVVVVAALTADLVVVVTATRLQRRLASRGRPGRRRWDHRPVAGVALIALGLAAALR